MRALVASSSGSAAALARPQRSLRPWSGSVLAVSNNESVAAGFAAAASTIKVACSSDSPPSRNAASTFG